MPADISIPAHSGADTNDKTSAPQWDAIMKLPRIREL